MWTGQGEMPCIKGSVRVSWLHCLSSGFIQSWSTVAANAQHGIEGELFEYDWMWRVRLWSISRHCRHKMQLALSEPSVSPSSLPHNHEMDSKMQRTHFHATFTVKSVWRSRLDKYFSAICWGKKRVSSLHGTWGRNVKNWGEKKELNLTTKH